MILFNHSWGVRKFIIYTEWAAKINFCKIIYKNCCINNSFLPIKFSSDDDPVFRDGIENEASLPLIQGAPAISHNTARLYWMVFDLYKCRIHSDAVTVLFWIFFIYSLFSAGESSSLVKNVEVEFEIKPRHPISRGNMSVEQPFLTHCSRRSSYFSNLCWCIQSMLTSKGIVNSAMITFLELTDQMMKSRCRRVDVISIGKVSCRSMSAITHQSMPPSSNVGLYQFLFVVFEMFPFLINCILVFIHEILLAVSQHIFAISAIILKISLCPHV